MAFEAKTAVDVRYLGRVFTLFFCVKTVCVFDNNYRLYPSIYY